MITLTEHGVTLTSLNMIMEAPASCFLPLTHLVYHVSQIYIDKFKRAAFYSKYGIRATTFRVGQIGDTC